MLRTLWLIFAQACTVALALLFVVQTLRPQWLPDEWAMRRAPAARQQAVPAAPQVATHAAAQAASHVQGSLAEAAARAAPAVVSIATSGGARPQRLWPFGGEGQGGSRRGVGSGVIVESGPEGGYVLTNHHVIEGAQRIDLQLSDGRETVAELVGTDPETDLALLQVQLQGLPVIALGDMRALQVGDVCWPSATRSTSARR